MSLPIKISVVLTVYNEQRHLARCLESIISQSFDFPFEVICVDDGSTDNSSLILQDFQTSSAVPFTIIRIQNSGSSATPRNVGMKLSSGEWICFVDGDDWLNPRAFEDIFLHSSCKDHDGSEMADIIIYGGSLVDDSTLECKPFQDLSVWCRLLDRANGLISPMQNLDLFCLDASICRRLLRKSFLESINFLFAPFSLFEDISANYHILLADPKVAISNCNAYNYRVGHIDRITRCSSEKLLDVHSRLRDCLRLLLAKPAPPELWSIFIEYQGWIHRWLLKQIQPELKRTYAVQCIRLYNDLPLSVQALFRNFSADDELSVQLRSLLIAQSRDDLPSLLAIAKNPNYD